MGLAWFDIYIGKIFFREVVERPWSRSKNKTPL